MSSLSSSHAPSTPTISLSTGGRLRSRRAAHLGSGKRGASPHLKGSIKKKKRTTERKQSESQTATLNRAFEETLAQDEGDLPAPDSPPGEQTEDTEPATASSAPPLDTAGSEDDDSEESPLKIPTDRKGLEKLVARAIRTATARMATSSTPRESRNIEVKISSMDRFDGGDGVKLQAWFDAYELAYEDFVVARGAKDEHFVAAAARQLSGAAVSWWTSLGAGNRPRTWEGMKAALKQAYQPVSPAERARKDLRNLTQKANQSVSDYAGEFRQLTTLSGKGCFADQVLMEMFKEGLRSRDIERELSKEPLELSKAMEIATRLDESENSRGSHRGRGASAAAIAAVDAQTLGEQLSAIQAQLNAIQGHAGPGGRPTNPGAPRGDRQLTRRERGANKTPAGGLLQSVQGLTEAKAKYRKENGLCMFCAGKDHIKRDCPDFIAGRRPNLN